MRLVKKTITTETNTETNKSENIEEIEKFRDGTSKEITIKNINTPTLEDIAKLLIANLKEKGWEARL